uniref:PX domain-containing protein n=1 Tax=Amorphochlora amoebiformis TaxID=1561963 RepID=A0A7S0CN41_9EUKA|mmetsp:Transcript_10312/g.16271  ORF Transcript_10312/g.16271 Transcript_10312/m.16271 type:complete len:764 (+) Transcript_10312:47-2338(+)
MGLYVLSFVVRIISAGVTAVIAVLAVLTMFHQSKTHKDDDESISLPTRLRRQRARTLAVEKELGMLCELILRDFIEYWYQNMSDDKEFTNNIRWALEHIVLMSMSRVLRIDWPAFVYKKILPALTDLIGIYSAASTKENLGDYVNLRPGNPKRVQRICEVLRKTNEFHTGIEYQEPYLRDFATALIGGLLQPEDFSCNAFRDLLRELLATKILASLIAYADPYWVNYGLWCLPDLSKPAPPPDAPPYYGPGYTRTEAQIKADKELEKRLKDWEEEKHRRAHDMEALVEGEIELNIACKNGLTFDAMWDLTIQGVRRRVEPKPFVSYEISVANGEYTWVVEKRYSDFKQLHDRLKKRFSEFATKVPGKHVLSNNMDPVFIQRRKQELQAYLQQLVWNRHVSESQLFHEFLVDRRQNIKAKRKGHRSSLPLDMVVTRSVRPIQEGLKRRNSAFMEIKGDRRRMQMGHKKTRSTFGDSLAKKKMMFNVPSLWKRKANPHLSTSLRSRNRRLANSSASSREAPLLGRPRSGAMLRPRLDGIKTTKRKVVDRKKHKSVSPSRRPMILRGDTSDAKDPEDTLREQVGKSVLDLLGRVLSLDSTAYVGHLGLLFGQSGSSPLADGALGAMKKVFTAPNIEWIIRYIREYTWPEGKELESGRDATPEEVIEAFVEGRKRLHLFFRSMGIGARLSLTPRIIDSLFEFVQIKIILKQFLFGVLEDVLLALLPELKAVSDKDEKYKEGYKSRSVEPTTHARRHSLGSTGSMTSQ